MIDGQYNDLVEAQHIARYKFAAPLCKGKTVADIACGSGYGMKIMRKTASAVDGYDIKDFGFKHCHRSGKGILAKELRRHR